MSGNEREGRRGMSRRDLLRAGGIGSAAVVVSGLTTRAAVAQPAGERPGRARGRREDLSVVDDPHAEVATSGNGMRQVRGVDSDRILILPIDRATFRPGGRFDLRIEVAGVDPEATEVEIVVDGPDGPAEILVGDPEVTSFGGDTYEVTYRDLAYATDGAHTVTATVTSGGEEFSARVAHEVLALRPPSNRARNVIFFLGDGMGQPAITAARILSKGIREGKYLGKLEMDTMQFRGLVGTSGVDSIATDSANSMSAYMCGHKSSVNAMGVYEGGDPQPDTHPQVENLTELVKRTRGMKVGVVTTSEVQDATPAAVWAHTRRRAEYLDITDQALRAEQQPDVLLGGGRASLLPQGQPGSRRDDDRDVIEEFRQQGFAYAATRTELQQALGSGPDKLLGLFHPGNLNVYLDRQHLPQADVLGEFDDQPNLMEMTDAALSVLGSAADDEGFLLVVEGASIDKMEHPLDGPRAVYDCIELDQALGVAKRWAEGRDDTLIVVTADHNHSMSIVGTNAVDPGGRAGNGVYGGAGFPTYVDSTGDGFPDDPDPDVKLFYGWSNHPDHTDDFRHNEVFQQPAVIEQRDGQRVAVDNPDRDPDAEMQLGNLPFDQTNCVHTVEDVPIFASGPGADRVNAFVDNTEVFHLIVDALAIDIPAETGDEVPVPGGRGRDRAPGLADRDEQPGQDGRDRAPGQGGTPPGRGREQQPAG